MKKLTWEQAKKYVSTKYRLSGSTYWEKVTSLFEQGFPMLGGGTSEDVSKELATQAQQSGIENANEIAASATELASHKMPSTIDPTSQEYAPMLRGLASEYIQPSDPNQNSSVFSPSISGKSSIFEATLEEDNYYNRTSIVVQNTGSDITIVTKDKFDFSLSSNKTNATAIAIENGATFEVKLRIVTKGSALWSANWKSIEKNGVESILRINVESLSINAQYMSVDENRDVSSLYYDSLAKTISKIVQTYNKLWGKSHYQLIVLSTNQNSKVELITKCADELKKAQGFSLSTSLTKALNQTNTAEWRKSYWIAIKNSSGKSFKEDVSSDAFIDVVPENATVVGQTKKDINAVAKKNFNKMKRKGFSAQLEKKLKEEEEDDQERTYYLQAPDGSVYAFDNKEKKDYFKDRVPDAKSIRAHDFFIALIDNEDKLQIQDNIFFVDRKIPVSTDSESAKASHSTGMPS